MAKDELFFDGQRDNEDVIRLWRRHPWTTLRAALLVLGLTLGVVASLQLAGASLVTSFLIGFWLIAVPLIVGYTWFIWWNGMYVLTNLRLIDIDQRRVFHRTVSELPIDMVQDVTFDVRGPVATLLNFGTVIVQTTGGGTTIELEQVTDPQSVQQAILRAAGKSRQADQNEDKSAKTQKPKPKTQLG
ncbi:PH domain-containing protein [Candidatus Berkelbacteria bacterium]|nr:PH domain-containing protein [Candidatus Berkelbacteria bacterium]